MKPKCPHLQVVKTCDEASDEVYEGYLCTFTDNYCLMEIDLECEIYNEWLKEEHNGTNQ